MKPLDVLVVTKHIFVSFKEITKVFLTFRTIETSCPKAVFYSQRGKWQLFFLVEWL